MKAGIIKTKIPMSDIYIVGTGWGQLRYFSSTENYQEGEVILYKEKLRHHFSFDDDETGKVYATREDWLNNVDSRDKEIDFTEIIALCRFDDCDFRGNDEYNENQAKFEQSKIAIARKENFVYWELSRKGTRWYCSRMQTFDSVSNALIFSLYAERRYPYPKEKDWLNAYTYAKRKVAEFDIPKMIDELKVEVHNNSWTRRGSDNILFGHSSLVYPYEYHYGHLHDKFVDAIFPEYSESLYSSKDGEVEYINPRYEKMEVIHMPGRNIIKEAKYDGQDLNTICDIKTKELRQIALKNYESYNIDEHVNYIAYMHFDWYCIHEEDKLWQKANGLAQIAWGFKQTDLLNRLTKDNYKDLVGRNNATRVVPILPENYD